MDLSQTRNTVISVRVDGISLQAIDLLVKAGLAQSRSEAAAQFVAMGIHSADQLLTKASQLADNLQQLKSEFVAAINAKDFAGAKAVLERNPELLRGWIKEGESPVLMSVYSGANELTQWLLERGAELTVYEAVAIGDVKRVGQFLDTDPTLIQVPSHEGWTLLNMAAYFGHGEVVNLLLDHGADVMERSMNDMANTPLHSALVGRRYSIAQLLVEHGSDANSSNRRGWTPLHLAASAGNLDMVMYLVQHGARLDVRNADKLTPAELANERGNSAVAEWINEQTQPHEAARGADTHPEHRTKSEKAKVGSKR